MPKEKKNKNQDHSKPIFPVVGIGASAGGLDAFKKLLKAIPENSGMAYVLVQHLDPRHESMLPEILQKITTLPLFEITDDIKVEPDHIYIIPSNKMLVANDGVLQLSPRPPKTSNEPNLPIDLFFSSLAEVYQSNAVGVVLSGSASDGTKGLKAIKDHGGFTFAQDEASAQFEGMPHSAAQAGVVDFILPPEEIPQRLIDIMAHLNRSEDDFSQDPNKDEEIFKQILALLRIRKGTDFTYYKQTTIRRRILRRMALNKNEDTFSYLKFLREKKAELDILYQDLLIPVTSFFRDRKSFDNLAEQVLANIITGKTGNEPLRVWVAGCSTGEEAFSIAICIKEFLNSHANTTSGGTRLNSELRVQIFATDISEPAIIKARRGIYSKSEIESIEPHRVQEFFVKINGKYQVSKAIRDICVFAVHNFLKDPPFAKMDLVTCRNVLIYMEPYLQKKALTTFHYALVPKGFLLLGKSETNSSVPDLFALVGKNDKLFVRKDVPTRYLHVANQRSEQKFNDVETNVKMEGKLADFQKGADDILLSKFAPAGVVVNEAMEIVHFRGATGAFLEPSPGKASFNLLKMIKEGLAFELRNILHKAKTEKAPVVKENIPVHSNGEQKYVTIEAIPLRNVIEPHYLVLFHEGTPLSSGKIKSPRKSPRTSNGEKDIRIQQLEQELAQTREDMRTITEDQEAANEELQSANEELLSSSEELQSLNEEMETSKEELQSTNEELIVINQEMISLNEQVTEARNYAQAIVTTIKEPLVILDKHLRVKSANQSFYKTFMVSETDTENKNFFELGDHQWDIPELRNLLEHIIPDKERFGDYEVKHVFQHIGERIMLLNAREMKEEPGSEKLILLALADITDRRLAENKMQESEKKFRTLADFIPQIIWTAQPDGKLDYCNRRWYTFTRFDERQEDQNWIQLLHPDDSDTCIAAWFHSLKTGEPYQAEHRLKESIGDEYRWFLAKASPFKDEHDEIIKWFGSFTDIEEQKTAADELLQAKEQADLSVKTAETAVRSKQQFLSNMSHEIRTPMNSIIGFTKVLLRTPLNEKQKEYIDAIRISGDIMIVLINDILDLAKVDAGKMNFQQAPFRLAETVSSMLQLFEIRLREKDIDLVRQYDPLIPEILSGDPVRLHQVILNLMSNAVKFTASGKITVGVRMLEEDAEKVKVEFSIADTGMGIPEDKLDRIFDTFEQAYTDNIRSFGGTGLGLTIVKKLVEAQGGTIQAKSKLGVGSVFTFSLWFRKSNERPADIPINGFSLENNGKDINIMVVEDIPLNQLLMKTLLSDARFHVDIAGNGKIAIEKITAVQKDPAKMYDIILMDLQMPEMNGFEATAYIRNTLQLSIPIIALTADVTSEDVRKYIEAGMNDYISKPVDENLLFTKISHLLEKPVQPVENNLEHQAPGRFTNLDYLKKRTKLNKALIMDMIRLYLEQTPPLVAAIKEAVEKQDWPMLKGAAHKMLVSFSIMGFDKSYEKMDQQLLDYDGNPAALTAITEMVTAIEAACSQAYTELQEDLNQLNSISVDKK